MTMRGCYLALVAALVSLPAAVPVARADVLVNDPSADSGNTTTQFETTLAVRGGTLCAGWLDTGPPIGTLAAVGRSGDGGASWADLGELPQQGDPVIAVHRASGTFYYAMIADIGGQSAIGVARSTDDCQSFGTPVNATPATSAIPGLQFNDKPWIAVDNSGGSRDGHVYVCWTRFFDANGDGTEDSSELRFSSSPDGGQTWTNEKVIFPSGTLPFGCNIQVGPKGEVYVAWAERFLGDIRVVRSNDGGASFSAARTVSVAEVRQPGVDRTIACGEDVRPTLTGDIRMAHQAWMAVDATGGPHSGDVYVAWVGDPPGLPDNADVFLARSSNGGRAWRARRIGGSGPTDQFEPNLSVGGNGQLAIAWYDRRNDPANNLAIDVYATYSLNGGDSFLPPSRITDASFPTPPLLPHYDPIARQCHWGEYLAVATDAQTAYFLWTDNRGVVTNSEYPNGRPDPDIAFDRAALPPIPENSFRFAGVRRNLRNGTARLRVFVPGEGELELGGAGIRHPAREADEAGRVGLPVRPRGRVNARLERDGEARVRARVTFTPTHGDPNTKAKRIGLRERD